MFANWKNTRLRTQINAKETKIRQLQLSKNKFNNESRPTEKDLAQSRLQQTRNQKQSENLLQRRNFSFGQKSQKLMTTVS
jgi:hypothetical protein